MPRVRLGHRALREACAPQKRKTNIKRGGQRCGISLACGASVRCSRNWVLISVVEAAGNQILFDGEERSFTPVGWCLCDSRRAPPGAPFKLAARARRPSTRAWKGLRSCVPKERLFRQDRPKVGTIPFFLLLFWAFPLLFSRKVTHTNQQKGGSP